MQSVIVELPRAVLADEAHVAALVAGLAFPHGAAVAVRVVDADALAIALADAGTAVSVPLLPATAGAVEISPGLRIHAPELPRVERFLDRHGGVADHIGINFSHRDVAEAAWHAFVERLAAQVPAYRLDTGSPNDIVFVVIDGAGTQPAAVLELVYDRAAAHTHVHFCVRVAADRAAVERAFAAPHGGYKPGDEAFFRSVPLPPLLRLPAYVDVAFADAPIAPWPQTVQAIGRRIAPS